MLMLQLLNIAIIVQVYVDIFATAILLFGGSLGCYGLQLFCKLKRVRSERTSSEMGKVAGLAVVSVICFSSSALIAFLTELQFSYHWNLKKMSGVGAPLLLVLYYFIGDFLA
ncbi:uncharacterized protein LOC123223413 [Mangifera indica]|uniref:uncharacterized protein LOC123223413 n=1 Tax=Mangifera indica TaxID=29780 RepID=UPI001CFB9232|nr:uncharacterized protein LOC123223413 [Mangifera indica]